MAESYWVCWLLTKLVKCVNEYNGAHRGNIAFLKGLKSCLEKCHFQSYLSDFCHACFPSAKQFFIHWEDLLPAVYLKSSQPTHTQVHYERKRKSSFTLQQQSQAFLALRLTWEKLARLVCLFQHISLSLPPQNVGLPHLPSAHYCCFMGTGLCPPRLNGLGLILQLLLGVTCPSPPQGLPGQRVKNEQLTQQYPGSVKEMCTRI